MKNFILIITLFSTINCISQIDAVNLKNHEFTILEIDSICTNDIGSRIYISDGRISSEVKKESSKKTEIIKGSGGYSHTLYAFHYNRAYYNTLTRKEQNKYNFEQNSRLIKGVYHSSIGYENDYGEGITGEFYYFNDILFHVKINLKKFTENKKVITQCFNFSTLELNNSKNIENILSMDLKKWITEESNEIIKIYNR